MGVPLIKHGFGKIISKGNMPKRILGVVVFLSGIFLVVGLFTQAAAMAVLIIIVINSIILRGRHPRSWTERLVKMAIAVSLVLTGPGLFAFDLPL